MVDSLNTSQIILPSINNDSVIRDVNGRCWVLKGFQDAVGADVNTGVLISDIGICCDACDSDVLEEMNIPEPDPEFPDEPSSSSESESDDSSSSSSSSSSDSSDSSSSSDSSDSSDSISSSSESSSTSYEEVFTAELVLTMEYQGSDILPGVVPGLSHDVYQTETDWDEDTLIWGNTPSQVGGVLDSNNVGSIINDGEIITYDVTSAVIDAIEESEGEVSFYLIASYGGFASAMRRYYATKENGTESYRPYLRINGESTIIPIDDSWVKLSDATPNGAEEHMLIHKSSTGSQHTYNSYLKFDISEYSPPPPAFSVDSSRNTVACGVEFITNTDMSTSFTARLAGGELSGNATQKITGLTPNTPYDIEIRCSTDNVNTAPNNELIVTVGTATITINQTQGTNVLMNASGVATSNASGEIIWSSSATDPDQKAIDTHCALHYITGTLQ